MLALAAFAGAMTAFDTSAQAGHRGRGLAIGLTAAAATAIILSESARAERRHYRRYRMSCRELYYRCEDGSAWACDKYDYRCD